MLDFIRAFLDRDVDALLGQEIMIGDFDARFAIYAVIFLGVLCGFEGLRQLFRRSESWGEARSRRLKMRDNGRSTDEILALLKPRQRYSYLNRMPIVGDLPAALRAAGIRLAPGMFLILCGVVFVAAAGIGAQTYPPVLAFGGALMFGFVIPFALLASQKKKQTDKLAKQLPHALDLMARGLRVGHPINTTLQSVADEMPDPIGTEFGLVVDQVSYGDDLNDAMRELAERVQQEDVSYLAIAVSMQHGSGGDLSRVLHTLARVIRARMTLRKKVKALSAEGRLTATILSAIPFLIGAVMAITSPTYYGDVMDDPLFWPTISAIGAALALNAVILFKLVNFRI